MNKLYLTESRSSLLIEDPFYKLIKELLDKTLYFTIEDIPNEVYLVKDDVIIETPEFKEVNLTIKNLDDNIKDKLQKIYKERIPNNSTSFIVENTEADNVYALVDLFILSVTSTMEDIVVKLKGKVICNNIMKLWLNDKKKTEHKKELILDMDKDRPMFKFFDELVKRISFFRLNTSGSNDLNHPSILDLEIRASEIVTKEELIKYIQILPRETVSYIEGLDAIRFKIKDSTWDHSISFVTSKIELHEMYERKGNIYITFKGYAFPIPKDR